jgi:two-component system chemotaxis response regulator CheB
MRPNQQRAGESRRGKRQINVLVVDDSAVVRQVMTTLLSQEKRIAVTVAADPMIAMGKMKKQRPDVIVLDIEMPKMDGLTFLRKIMAEDPIPVVICSGHAGQGTDAALQALEEGAVEVVAKPVVGIQEFLYESALMLIDTVLAAAQARLRTSEPAIKPATPKLSADAVLPRPRRHSGARPTEQIIAMGASTGGTEALREVLEVMPLGSPGLVIVQHMPKNFTGPFARRLNQTCGIEVKEAENGDEVLRGRALIAPGDQHMVLRHKLGSYSVDVTGGALVSRHRPSVDVLFRSVAQAAGPSAVGVIMTGMGDDGARGLAEMKEAGAMTIAQNQATSVVFGMPKEAIDAGAVHEVVALHLIPSAILKQATSKR